jgi:hypothetical protein
MAAEESYKLVAALAIHRLFIRELLVLASDNDRTQ